MKNFKSLLLIALTLLAFSCKKEEPAPVPKEPQAPEIIDAKLAGVNGETKIKVGKKVVFSAKFTVQNSELASYTVEVKKGEQLIGTIGGVLEGSEATVSEEFALDIDASTLTAEFTPTVYVKVTNTDDMYSEKTLDNSAVVSIFPPELLPQMYLVDNAGKVFEMNEMSQKGRYRTFADISEIGSSITVCEKVTEDGKPDGETHQFETPVSEYGLRWIGYDAITGELFKEIDLTLTLDRNNMDMDAKKYYVFWCQELIPDCEVEFLNFGDKMLLQSDRFADVVENKARYTGSYSDKFEVYYIADEKTNWLTIKGQWSDNSVVWVTGENGSAPMTPYCDGHALNWFEGNPACGYSALTCVQESDNVFKCLMYLKENYAFKIFDYWAWANELAWTSTTPGTMVITPMEEDPETGKLDGNYANPGPEFTEGLWLFRYNKLTKEASLEKYTGRIADPVKGVEFRPDPPTPPTGSFFIVDNANNAWAMSVVSGTKYLVDESLSGISSSFVFAEKFVDGAIDWSGKVYGIKNGVIDEIAQGGEYIALDPAYAVYGKSPWQIYFDTATKELTYKEGFWKNGMGDMGDGSSVIWVQTLPHNAEVHFFDFDKPVSQTVNLAVFDNIDDTNNVARYIGYSENYEAYYRAEQGWLILSNNICAKQMLLIGKNASFGQSPYTEFPIIETDIPRTAGKTLPLNRLDEHNYSAYIYMAENASFQLYTDYSWGALNNSWTSTTEGIVTREEFYAKLGPDFYPGLYQITYNDENDTFTLVAKSSKPEEKPIETLYLVDSENRIWPMELVEGTHFCTTDGTSGVGSSFVFAEKVNDGAIDWSGRVFGIKNGVISKISAGDQQIAIDPAYAVYGKTPWKIGFDVESLEVIYREGIWKNGMGDMGDGSSVIWVQTLPHNCELFFFDFGKNVSEMVNLAVFDNINDTAASARYIGVSENYEVYYRAEQGWLILTNNICAKQMLLIGKNASFGQSPYTDYPIIETDIPRTAGKTLPLNRLDEHNYSAYIYMASDASFQVYTDYSWGALNQTWASATENLVTRENFYAKLGPDFVPGLYQITFNDESNTVTLAAK